MKIWEYYEINNFIWNQQMQKKNTLKNIMFNASTFEQK